MRTFQCLIVGDYVTKRGDIRNLYGVGEVKAYSDKLVEDYRLPLYRVEWESSARSGVTSGWYRQGELRKVTGEASDELLPVEKGAK